MTAACHPFTLARRAERMNPSIIREILKVTERPDTPDVRGLVAEGAHLGEVERV